MSVERVEGQRTRKRWRVRWRDEQGRARSRRVETKRQADWLDGEIKRRKIGGELIALERSTETLEDFFEHRYWPNYAVPSLARNTRDTRQSNWRAKIRGHLGDVPLRNVSAEHVDRFKASLGELSPLYQRTILGTLHGILEKAVEWGYIRKNPASVIRMPPRRRERAIRPLLPGEVENIRSQLPRQHRIIVSLMAYAGLRPVELRKLRWEHVRDRTLHLPSDVTKGSLPARTVPLWGPLRDDLAEWSEYVGVEWVRPNRNGDQMSAASWNGWQTKVFAPVAHARAYDLRHSYVSLLVQSGTQILEVARRAGHSPTMTLETYGHLFDELDPSATIDPEAMIYEAREGLRTGNIEPSFADSSGRLNGQEEA